MSDGGLAGTPAFMAPELLDENVFTEKSDVYSYAMVLWEIYDRRLPWTGLKPQQILSKVLIKRARPEVPKDMPDDMVSLMRRAWADKPDARPSFGEICKQLKATTPKRPSSTSEIRPWSSPRAADEQRQGSMRSMFARALSNFRSTSSLDVGGDKDDDDDNSDAPAAAQEAPAATEAVQAPTATTPAKSSASAKKATKAPIKAAPRPAATKKAPTKAAPRPAPAPAKASKAGASRSNWFKGPTKKAPAAETDVEAPPAPAQPAPAKDLEAQPSAAAGDVEAEDGPAAVAAGTQSSAISKLRAAIHASTAFRATSAPPPPPESRGGPPDLPPPAPSSPWFDSNF